MTEIYIFFIIAEKKLAKCDVRTYTHAVLFRQAHKKGKSEKKIMYSS